MIAVDPIGHRMGLNRRDVYSPMDRFKQTLVGLCRDYSFFDGSGAEADWCLVLDPHEPFRFILDDVVQVMDSTGDLQVRDGRRCVECEVTPDEQWYRNDHFPKDGASPQVGKAVGLYGPWVRDGGHGDRPEIHPCEIIWWHDDVGPLRRDKWTVLVVQDDSNRFDRTGDFTGAIQHPWSKPPRRASIAFALQLRKGFAYRYQLRLARHRNVAVMGGPLVTLDQGDYVLRQSLGSGGGGRLGGAGVALPVLTLRIDKRITMTRDLGPGDVPLATSAGSRTIPPVPDVTSPGMLDARASVIHPSPAGGDLHRCFVTVEVQVGTSNDRGGEGYAEIVLEQTDVTQLNVFDRG